MTCVKAAGRRSGILSQRPWRDVRRGSGDDGVEMDGTVSFRVVKEPYGWAVRMGEGMMTPFRSRASALEHATGCAANLREHGQPAEVILEDTWSEVRSFRPRSRFPAFWG